MLFVLFILLEFIEVFVMGQYKVRIYNYPIPYALEKKVRPVIGVERLTYAPTRSAMCCDGITGSSARSASHRITCSICFTEAVLTLGS